MKRSAVMVVVVVDLAMAGSGVWLIRRATLSPQVAEASTPIAAPVPAVAPAPEPAPDPAPATDPAPAPAPDAAAVAEVPKARTTSPAGVRSREPIPPLVLPKPDAAPPPPPDAAPPPPAPPDAAARPPPDAAPPDASSTEPPPSIEDQVADAIRRKIEANRAQIESCHERAARAAPPDAPPAGRIDLALRVLPDGDAADVRVVKNDTGSEALGACVVALVAGWRFPGPPHNGIDYVWPFIFSSRAGR